MSGYLDFYLNQFKDHQRQQVLQELNKPDPSDVSHQNILSEETRILALMIVEQRRTEESMKRLDSINLTLNGVDTLMQEDKKQLN